MNMQLPPPSLNCCSRIGQELEEHIAEEENKLFPELKKVLGRDKLVTLNKEAERVRMVAPTRPHVRSSFPSLSSCVCAYIDFPCSHMHPRKALLANWPALLPSQWT